MGTVVVVSGNESGLAGLFGGKFEFGYHETTQVEQAAPVAYERARYFYEANGVMQEIHVWAVEKGLEVWSRTKPWYCSV